MMFCQNTTTSAGNIERDLPNNKQYRSSFSNGEFTRQAKVMNTSFFGYISTTWDFLFGGSNRTPDSDLPVKTVDLSSFNKQGNNQLNVTWLGHSSLMINIDGYRILTDPVFEKSVSIVGPSRFNGDVPFNVDALPEIDAVIISHDHYDHLNKFSIKQLKDKTKVFIAPLKVGNRLAEWGIAQEKIRELYWWEEFHIDRNLMIAATPSQHFSGRGLFDRNQTLWASWVISTSNHKLFFSGDSGYFDGFKQIGEKYGPFDITFIECGAYNKAWANVHLFPEQTIRAHLDLKGNILHPIHWGTFNLSLHPWYEPMERLTSAAKTANVPVATPIVGDTTVYNTTIPDARWWQQAMAQNFEAQLKPEKAGL